jgi:diguanylate cyclase (GGDEF)-like protein
MNQSPQDLRTRRGSAVSLSDDGRHPAPRLAAYARDKKSRSLQILFVALFSLCSLLPLAAQSFSVRLFNQEDGLDNRSIVALAQQADGHLWIGTENGLFRYDGATFHKFDRQSGFTDTRIYNVFIDPAGTVWASTASGLFYLEGETFHELRQEGQLVYITINSRFTASPTGEVIASESNGHLDSIERDPLHATWSIVPFAKRHPGYPANQPVSGILLDRSSTLWIGCARSLCAYRETSARAKSGPPRGSFTVLPGVPEDIYDELFEDRSGRLYARAPHHLVTWMPGDPAVTDLTAGLPAGTFQTYTRRITQDPFGDLILTTAKGFARRTGNTWIETIETTKGAIDGATDLLSDLEGNLWIGSAGLGLFESLGYRRWSNLTSQQGLSSPQIYAIARDAAGHTWLGNSLGIDLLDRDGLHLLPSPLAHEKNSSWVENLAPTPDGGMWAATLSGQIWHFDRNRRIDYKTNVAGEVQRIRADKDGALWIAASADLYKLPVPFPPDPNHWNGVVLRGDFFADMFFAPDGTLWIVGNHGLYRMRNGQTTNIPVPGTTNRFVLIAPGQDNTLWLAGHLPGAIQIRVQNDTATILHAFTAPELSSDYIEFLEPDASGRIWAGTDHGVNIIDHDSVRRITSEDGLVWDDADWKAFLADPDGAVWIGTSAGLSHLTQPNAVLGRQPFHAAIDNPYFGAMPLQQGASVPWKDGAFSTRISGLTFRDNRSLLFHYRLKGFDEHPIDSQFPIVRYHQLPPGTYTLEVVAEDVGHHMLSEPATLTFTLVPPWWRSNPAKAVYLLVLLTLPILLWQWRYRVLLSQRERLQGLVDERTAELQKLAHTDSLTGLLNRGAIMTRLEAAVAAARERRTPLSIAIVDLDRFKEINDTHGHLAGDEVLRVVAERLKAGVRTMDFVGRYGGEEFLIIFNGIDREFGRKRCEDIRSTLCGQPIPIGAINLTITASIGFAWIDRPVDGTHQLVALADRALYLAKANGRNRVESGATDHELIGA